MNFVSFIVGLYMLLMGAILVVSSAFYRIELNEMESGQGILCTRSLYYTKIHRSKEFEENSNKENIQDKVPLCHNMKYWKLYSEIGIISGSTYILFLLSFIVVSCCCSKNQSDYDEEIQDVEEVKTGGKRENSSNCCSNWVLAMTSLLGLVVVTLALSFIFLSSTQLQAISTLDYKGDYGEILEMYPPLILYIASIWHFVILSGFCIWLGMIVCCPSFLSISQCVVI